MIIRDFKPGLKMGMNLVVQVMSLMSGVRRLSAEIDFSTAATTAAASSSTTVRVSRFSPLLNASVSGSPHLGGHSEFKTSIPSVSDVNSYAISHRLDKDRSEGPGHRDENDSSIWTQVTSTYSLITTQFNPLYLFSSANKPIEKRGMKDKQMMKMMKKTNMMNTMMNMMNAMMKYKMKKKKMKYKYKTKKMKYKLAKEKEKNKMKKYKMKKSKKKKSKCKGDGKQSQFVNVQKVSFKKVPYPVDAGYKKPKKGYGGYSGCSGGGCSGGGYAEPETYPEPEAYPFPEPEIFPLPEPEITVNKKFVNYNYDYNDYSSFPGQLSTPGPTTIEYYEYEYESGNSSSSDYPGAG